MRGPRRGRLAALVAAVALGGAVPLGTGWGTPSAAGPIDCTLDPSAPECTTTTTIATTTSTTVLQTTTTAFVAPTTTRQQTITTQAPVESTTSTSLEVATSRDVLVPGDGTKGAESTTTTLATPSTVSSNEDDDAALLALIVGGLVLLAIAVGILTWRYWVATRPPPGPTVGSDRD